VRRRPYTVVLLDEVEKAHPRGVRHLVAGADDGRLTDGKDAPSTSATHLGADVNLGRTTTRPHARRRPRSSTRDGVVRASFKPEFLNRLDDIVLFDAPRHRRADPHRRPAGRPLARRLAERRIALEVTEAAKEWLALTGFDPVYGARPLRRLVQSAIGDELARGLLAGRVRDGSTVRVDVTPERDRLAVEATEPATP
jgi:ATP-dependent Clp protease ATP-binding subunit ClpB